MPSRLPWLTTCLTRRWKTQNYNFSSCSKPPQATFRYSSSSVPCPRFLTDRVQPHLKSFYSGLDDLWNDHVDAAIITGTEPRQPDLRQEPYWAELTQIMDWAERNTTSTVLSCLAAHAGVLHSDGIPRHRLNDKRFGVFDSKKIFEHTLTAQLASPVRFPHSRWNEVRADELHACGYAVLTESERAGVDVFVKNK